MEKIKRDTSTDLMNNVLSLVKENGCYAGALLRPRRNKPARSRG
jgi:hypothetical protein